MSLMVTNKEVLHYIDETDYCKLWGTKLLLQCTLFIELSLTRKFHENLASETRINP